MDITNMDVMPSSSDGATEMLRSPGQDEKRTDQAVIRLSNKTVVAGGEHLFLPYGD